MRIGKWAGIAMAGSAVIALVFAARMVGSRTADAIAIRDVGQEAVALRFPPNVLGVKWLMDESAVREIRPAVSRDPTRPGWLLERTKFGERPVEVGYYLPQGNVVMYFINFIGAAPQVTIEALQDRLELGNGPMGQAVQETDKLSEKICWKRSAGRFGIEHCFRNSTIGFLEYMLIYRSK